MAGSAQPLRHSDRNADLFAVILAMTQVPNTRGNSGDVSALDAPQRTGRFSSRRTGFNWFGLGGGKPRNVGPENYINRLWMFIADSMSGSTHSKLLLATLQDLGSRVDKVYSMTNKGVHNDVDLAEGRHLRHADLSAGR
jgi:hypothetical protein